MTTGTMTFDERYRAISARDIRFDGQFVTAVRSTGIYCRPSCPARTPKPANVTFYPTSAAAHEAGYRACKRCLPEATPGSPAWNLRGDAAARAMRLIAAGVVEQDGVPGLAQRLGYSPRHLTRLLTTELGAGPLALARAHRAHTARMLLVGTDMPISEVAFSAGFASIRQCNDTIREVFEMTPGELRGTSSRSARSATASSRSARSATDSSRSARSATGSSRSARSATGSSRSTDEGHPGGGSGEAQGVIDLLLPHRAPIDASGVFAWMAARALPGVEVATATSFARHLRMPGGPAHLEIRQDGEGRLRLRARVTRLGDLAPLVATARRLFDLDADPVAVDEALSAHPELAPLVTALPGIRVPGAADPHEMLIRAMVGQQITVAAARTALTALADQLGERTADGGILFPTMAAIAEHGAEVLRGPAARIRAITGAAAALADGSLELTVGDDAAEQRARLLALPGIGPWTADYVRMRVIGDPDVFLPGDVAMRAGAAASGLPADPVPLTAWAERLAPWRSYLTAHLWRAAPVRAPRRPRPPSAPVALSVASGAPGATESATGTPSATTSKES